MRHFHSAILLSVSLTLLAPGKTATGREGAKRASHAASSAKRNSTKPQTKIPIIARVLGVRIGWNGQDRLERRFGTGVRSIGGHPNGVETWRTRYPTGKIVTDGFNYNDEGEVLETLEWTLGKASKEIPLAHNLPDKGGWLGTITLGMPERQVTRLLIGTHLPKPNKSGGTWTWVQKGYVQLRENVEYRIWTAALGFDQGRLTSICVRCD